MKKKLTYKQLINFSNYAAMYLDKHAEDKTKMVESIKSIQKQIKSYELIEKYYQKIGDNNLDCCSVDDRLNILKDSKDNLLFTVEKQKEVNKFNRELLKEEVEINSRILVENDSIELTEEEKDAFSGIVITEIFEPKNE